VDILHYYSPLDYSSYEDLNESLKILAIYQMLSSSIPGGGGEL